MMNLKQFFRFITVDPVNLSIKGKLLSVVSSFIAILAVAWITRTFGVDHATNPIIVASMGASAVILFITPGSPLAQPWPLVAGQVVSALTGVMCSQLFTDMAFAAAFAVGGSILLMLLCQTALKSFHNFPRKIVEKFPVNLWGYWFSSAFFRCLNR